MGSETKSKAVSNIEPKIALPNTLFGSGMTKGWPLIKTLVNKKVGYINDIQHIGTKSGRLGVIRLPISLENVYFPKMIHENRNLIHRVRQLTSALEQCTPIAELNYPRPLKWPEFLDWIDQVYPDKISLTAAARRMTRAPKFEDIALVTRCIDWLATVQHETRIGGGGSLRDVSIEKGIINSPCGGDEYSINWQG